MSKADKDHFLSYKEQTRIKHQILRDYLLPYFKILNKNHKNLIYIDGFAGAGNYTNVSTNEKFQGSPLIALEIISQNELLSKTVRSFFIESRKDHFADLKVAIDNFQKTNPSIIDPEVVNNSFQNIIESLREHLAKNGNSLAPTFLFVDPCGVDGVHFDSIVEILSREWCEVLIFFNIDGVRRILGLKDNMAETLPNLLGNESRVESLLKVIENTPSPKDKETIIIDAYCKALTAATNAEYILPFRVESEAKRNTSHYFIHATKHPIGFKIMKEVMWKAGKTNDGDEGRLELLQSSSDDLSTMMRPDLHQMDIEIIDYLDQNGPTRVSVFREDWPLRPHDRFVDSTYRRRLLQLEADGTIIVLEADCVTPAGKRQMRKGELTLATRFFVSLKK